MMDRIEHLILKKAGELQSQFDRIESKLDNDVLHQLNWIEDKLDRLAEVKSDKTLEDLSRMRQRGTPIYGNGVSSNKITLKDHGLSDPNVFEPVSGDDEILKEAQAKIDKIKLVKAGEKITKHDLVYESDGVVFRSMPKGGKK